MFNEVILSLLHWCTLACIPVGNKLFTAGIALRRVPPSAGGRGKQGSRKAKPREDSWKRGCAWTETGTTARDRDRLAACRQSGDHHDNKAWYDPLFIPKVPLSLFSLSKFLVNLPRARNSLHPELHFGTASRNC